MNVRAICEGHIMLPIPPAEAIPLFTPEGERRWAGASWDPVYAIPQAAHHDSAPCTVFTTQSDSGSATWIVLDHSDNEMRYARIVPEHIARIRTRDLRRDGPVVVAGDHRQLAHRIDT